MACLENEERRDMERWVFPRRLAVREALFRPGQWPAFVHVLREGSLKLVREDAGQGATVVETAQPGDWIGLSWTLRNEPYSVLAEALEPSAVCSLRSEDFLRHFSANPEFNLAISRQVAAKLESAQSMLWLRSRHDAASRLAACLLHLDDQRPKDAPPGVLLTKSDLGQIIATAQETVFRLLTKFEARGLLRREDRRILLTNRPGLQAVADSARNTGPGQA
jgi:CRP-like cAMP-binding protein